MQALDLRHFDTSRSWRSLLLCIFAGGTFYGAVMGMYGGISTERILQPIYSATKVPFLLLVSFVLTLPSFFVINTLLGLREDFGRVLKAMLATQAVLAVILASLAPYTALWYVSTESYQWAQMINLAMFALASLAAQIPLRRMYRPLIARNPRHRVMIFIWLGIYAFVGMQMAWVLRPFIGAPNVPTRFFREDAWSNAYVVVVRLIWRILTGDT